MWIALVQLGSDPPRIWRNGSYSYALLGEPFSSGNRIGSLPEGTYFIVMRDINGCLTDVEVTIEEPFALRGSIESQPVLCFGDSNGVAEVFMNGGTLPMPMNGPMAKQLGGLPNSSWQPRRHHH